MDTRFTVIDGNSNDPKKSPVSGTPEQTVEPPLEIDDDDIIGIGAATVGNGGIVNMVYDPE